MAAKARARAPCTTPPDPPCARSIYFALRDALQGGVAPETPRRWPEHILQAEPPHNFARLRLRDVRSRAVAIPHHRVHEEAAIAREQCALLRPRERDEVVTLRRAIRKCSPGPNQAAVKSRSGIRNLDRPHGRAIKLDRAGCADDRVGITMGTHVV